MIWDFLRGLANAVRSDDVPSGLDPTDDYQRRDLDWHWRCECGSHSRYGGVFKADADQNAFVHQNRKGVGHPMPEVYSTPR